MKINLDKKSWSSLKGTFCVHLKTEMSQKLEILHIIMQK